MEYNSKEEQLNEQLLKETEDVNATILSILSTMIGISKKIVKKANAPDRARRQAYRKQIKKSKAYIKDLTQSLMLELWEEANAELELENYENKKVK